MLSDYYHGIASRERRMIRAGKRYIHQSQDGMEETLRLAQRQAKEQPERERRLDGDVGIQRLSTTLAGLRRCPGIDGVVCGAPSCASPLAAGIGYGSSMTLGSAAVKST